MKHCEYFPEPLLGLRLPCCSNLVLFPTLSCPLLLISLPHFEKWAPFLSSFSWSSTTHLLSLRLGFSMPCSLVWTSLILFGEFYTEDRLASRYSQELLEAFILSFRLRLAEYVNKKSICWYSVVFGSKFPSAAGLQSWGERRTRSLIGFSVSTHLSHPYTSKECHQKGQLGQQNSFIRHMATWKHASG